MASTVTGATDSTSVAAGPTHRSYAAARVSTETVAEVGTAPDDPDIVNGGSAESEEIPVGRPSGGGHSGGRRGIRW